MIKGWDEGVIKMSLGEKAKLTISPDFGYGPPRPDALLPYQPFSHSNLVAVSHLPSLSAGARGAGGVIPPNATLIFEVELLKIN